MKFEGQNVLITGGASGIGRIMCGIALEKGAAGLIIWDINSSNIDSAVAEMTACNSAAGRSQAKVSGMRVDVSDSDAVSSAYAAVKEEFGFVDIIIQCAGIVTGNKTFDRMGFDEIDRTMTINAIAPMYVARSVLPDMIRRNHGHICTITSAGGMLSNPKMSVYAASKWAATGWSDSVRLELESMKSNVHVTTVAPYYINTGMFNGVKSKIFPILDPRKTSYKIIQAIEKNRGFRGIPFGFHFIRFWQGLLPTRFFDWLFGEVVGIYHTMDNFTGRKNDAEHGKGNN